MIRYRLNWDKLIEAIDFLSMHHDGITQYYIGKVCYFADKSHMLDYGRPVTGDRYVAMEHGPVPSTIYNLLKTDSGLPDEVIEKLLSRVRTKQDRNLIHVSSRKRDNFEHLSGSDREYLLASLKSHVGIGFAELKRKSHDAAWDEAWAQPGFNNEMDLSTWLNELPEEDQEGAREYLAQDRVYAA